MVLNFNKWLKKKWSMWSVDNRNGSNSSLPVSVPLTLRNFSSSHQEVESYLPPFECGSTCALGLPGGLVNKESACNAGDTGGTGSIPGSRRSTGIGRGNPFQYACLENSMDRGAWWATDLEVAESQTCLRDWLCTLTAFFNLFHSYISVWMASQLMAD